jgi:prepilin-type N-terminal cleavage/methylation domain-containing protein
MIRIRSHKETRSAFTLIELLVVIAIIAILVSLTGAAVMKVMLKIPQVQTSTEIGEMGTAMGSFMATYNLQNPPPSTLHLCENGTQYYNSNGQVQPQYQSTVKFLQKWFGRSFNVHGTYDWNGNGNPNETYTLTGQQCLVFYLGGIPTYSPSGIGMTGFAMNVANPAVTAAPGTNRNGPYFNFKSSNLVLAGSFPVYMDPWHAKPTPQAYAFFSSQGKVNGYSAGDCAGVAFPYYELTAAGLPNYANNNSFQIISAGQNGIFGGTRSHTAYGVAWNPSSGATGAGADDQSNFSSTILGAGQH